MEKEKRKHGEPRRNIFMAILSVFWTILSSIGKGIGWMLGHVASGVWSVIQLISKGAWYVFGQAWQGVVWLLKQPYRLLRYIIVGRIPEFENARQEEIFWRIKRQFRRKRLILLNAAIYGTALIIFSITLGDAYFRWQRAIQELDQFVSYYASNFYNILTSGGIVMVVWTVLLIFHFVFNKMGDAEDRALGAALENEYARSEARERNVQNWDSKSSAERLVDMPQDDYDYYEEEDEKPKRNGARL